MLNFQDSPKPIGRFAPSPTGPLHLGSLVAALGSWLNAKSQDGLWLLRIDDLDHERCKARYSQDIQNTLALHGLHPDGNVIYQSQRHAAYQAALERLQAQELVYPCACTRQDLEAANAHRPPEQNRVYPGTCRLGIPANKTAKALRFRCDQHPLQHWNDGWQGPKTDNLEHSSGDFVLKRGDGQWAYHLAVVVDDMESGVTEVVRGADLMQTTARQLALYQALGARPPRYMHLPVVMGENGQKLSKQQGSKALDTSSPSSIVKNLSDAGRHLGIRCDYDAGRLDTSHWLRCALEEWKLLQLYSNCSTNSTKIFF